MIDWKKAARTAQNFFPWSIGLKNAVYFHARKYLRIPHEQDFAAIALLPKAPDDLFLDIGGNRGQSILSFRLYRPDVAIVSFEPNPAMYAEIRRRFAGDPRLIVHNFGLGAADAVLPLYLPYYRGFMYDGDATFSRRAAVDYLSPKTLYFFDPKKLRIEEHPCPVRTLDGLGLAPSFVKIDVEGGEYDVIRGGIETLRRHEPVVLIERYWRDERVFGTLAGLGYVEVVAEEGRFVMRATERENALMMTPRRLAFCNRENGASAPGRSPTGLAAARADYERV